MLRMICVEKTQPAWTDHSQIPVRSSAVHRKKTTSIILGLCSKTLLNGPSQLRSDAHAHA